jgi:hypothetical protein
MTDQTQTMSPQLDALVKADADFNAAVAAWKDGTGSLKRLHRALMRYSQSVGL